MAERSGQQSLWYKSALIFALMSILPILLYLYLLTRHNLLRLSDVRLIFSGSVILALLGFMFFRRFVRQISRLSENFQKLEQGEVATLDLEESPHELSEMARIADSFRKILDELKTNTQELENLIFKLGTLSELTDLVARIPNIHDVLQLVLNRAMTTVRARIGSIMLLDQKRDTLKIVASDGLDSSIVEGTVIHMGEGIAGKVAQTGEPMLVEDLDHDERVLQSRNPKYDSASFICMPLRVQDRIIGVLNLTKKGDQQAFSESDLKFINTLLAHIGFAVENARLLKEAREAARQLQRAVEEKSLQLDQSQQQVLQSAKLSAIGQLVAGVAHELNNPLTSVMGYSQLLLGKAPEELRRDLNKIFGEAQRAAKIVQNLLSFARQEPPEKRLVDIHNVLRKVIEMREYDLQVTNTELKLDFDDDVPEILVDDHQIQQVFLNLLNNAHQAMLEQEGTSSRGITITSRIDDDRVQIEIADTGPGIPPEFKERIFNPFFTTKGRGQGTGLGLSISYGIVQAHGGNIFAENNAAGGASFFVELPLTGQEAKPLAQDIREVSHTSAGKILVVEDEENINDLITAILTNEGYQVDAVRSGDQGLTRLRGGKYDLVVCDLWMPGLHGQNLYKTAKKENPQLCDHFIFMTGDILNDVTRSFLEESGNLFIQKPFTKESFLNTVGQAWQRIG